MMGMSGQWVRGEPVEVSQSWLDKNSIYRGDAQYIIEGDEGVTADQGNDGIPDSGWTKRDISAWLKGKGEVVSGYNTKSKLLDMVESVLNPPAPEPEPVVEEAPVVVEIPVEEAVEEIITGDEQ
jgi:hypothetical protein